MFEIRDSEVVIQADNDGEVVLSREEVGLLLESLELIRHKTEDSSYSGLYSPKKRPWIRTWMVLGLFPFATLLQMFVIGMMYAADSISRHGSGGRTVLTVFFALGIILQSVLVTFVVSSAIKIAKQLRHGTSSISSLASAYLSVIMLFGGIYGLISVYWDETFANLDGWKELHENKHASAWHEFKVVVEHFVAVLFFSAATTTGVGFGFIAPIAWYTRLIVMVQMLIGVVFNIAVFSRGVQYVTAGSSKKSRLSIN